MNQDSISRAKVLILECLVAERNMGEFMAKLVHEAKLSLSDTEGENYSRLMGRLSICLDRIKDLLDDEIRVSDAGYHPKDSDNKRPPDKLPVYPGGGSYTRLIRSY